MPLIILATLGVAVGVSRRYTRGVVFGSLFFSITILPVLKLIPFGGGGAVAADRYMYLPSIGLFYIAGLAVQGMCRWKTRWEMPKRAVLGLLLASSVVTLAVMTWQRCNVWQNSETLWLSVLAVNPNVPLAHTNLGNFYDERGQLDEAITEFQKSLALGPDNAEVLNNLGALYETKGWLDEALAQYQKAVAVDPTFGIAHNNLGAVYEKRGLLDEALAQYQKALAIDPTFAVAHYNVGLVYQKKGRLDEAVSAYRKAVGFNPTERVFSDHLAFALRAGGQSHEVDEILKKTLSLVPADRGAAAVPQDLRR